ncbi:MAG TPA: CSLREA domain-containing protein, partial [Thermoanaerobaculia bacterium]|nr:CSLREA domain-containing protein [Thermoanaerobaculia bacterium]
MSSTLTLATLLAFALPAAGATFNVTKTADTADGACNADCSLREAVIAANATASTPGSPNVINLPAGTYDLNPSGVVGTGELRLGGTTNKGTNIVGAGAATTVIHQANSGFRVFDLDDFQDGGVSVTLSDLTISGGVSQTFGGGAILGGASPPDSLSLTNVTITGSTGVNAGAGIKWTGGNVTITNCVFTNNVSSSQGGALNYYGGGGSASLTITGSTFSGNASGNAIAGGALLLSGGFSTFSVSNSTFVGNQATNASGVGGAIFVNSGTLTASFNRFVGNTAGVATSGA